MDQQAFTFVANNQKPPGAYKPTPANAGLAAGSLALAAYEKLSYLDQREQVEYVLEANTDETRQRHFEKMIRALKREAYVVPIF